MSQKAKWRPTYNWSPQSGFLYMITKNENGWYESRIEVSIGKALFRITFKKLSDAKEFCEQAHYLLREYVKESSARSASNPDRYIANAIIDNEVESAALEKMGFDVPSVLGDDVGLSNMTPVGSA